MESDTPNNGALVTLTARFDGDQTRSEQLNMADTHIRHQLHNLGHTWLRLSWPVVFVDKLDFQFTLQADRTQYECEAVLSAEQIRRRSKVQHLRQFGISLRVKVTKVPTNSAPAFALSDFRVRCNTHDELCFITKRLSYFSQPPDRGNE